jgi:hypothetical protein
MKFKVIIKHIIEENHEMILEGDSIVDALDEARRLAALRNETNKHGTFHLTKIETEN